MIRNSIEAFACRCNRDVERSLHEEENRSNDDGEEETKNWTEEYYIYGYSAGDYDSNSNEYTEGIPYILQNGYNQKRSGDILLVPSTGYISYSRTGSTHGSAQIYDTHVPLLLYGKGIKQGSTVNRTEIPDIAPTIAALLGIAFPNGATGQPIGEVLEFD